MRAIVLGSAAGGGVPQWNCGCAICGLARSDDGRVRPRTQSGLAVVAGGECWAGECWALVNASPDIGRQIEATPTLRPRHGLRASPIQAVILTNADVDHVAGLLTLREGGRFRLWATSRTHRSLAANPIFDVLARDRVERREAGLDESFSPVAGLEARLFAVPGKAALWEEGDAPVIGAMTEATVGVEFTWCGRRLAYIPGCAEVTPDLRDRLRGVDVLMFDGTVHHDDDMIRAGVGPKTGRRMGHVAMAGPAGSLLNLADLGIGRRIYTHLNNTNPVLVEGSEARASVEAAGWTVAHDGLEVAL